MENIYNTQKVNNRKLPKFAKEENVRISKFREAFTKGYTLNWSNEVFKIRKVNYTNPPTYLLKDQSGQDIQGAFYTEELLKTSHPNIYLIEKVLKKR